MLLPAVLASAVAPAPAVQMVVGRIGQADASGVRPLELIALNPAATSATIDVPERIEAVLRAGGTAGVTRAVDQLGQVTIAAEGFARLRFQVRATEAGVLSLPSLGISAVMSGERPTGAVTAPAAAAPGTLRTSTSDSGNAFLANLSAYEPIYAVYGPGTNSDARLQISFKYQLFGRAGTYASWRDGIQFAFTQRIFWDLGRKSSPFRNVDYMPEIFYLVPDRPVGAALSLGGQAGFRHESNGRDGDDSRSVNTLYVQPVATLPLGGYTLSIGPRLWAYVGRREGNTNIAHYRGNTGLFAQIGRDDGLRLSTTSRFNPGSGKGAINAELSYPVDRVIDSDLNLYLFGQAFTGYGENLLDYDRRQTRVRIGIGIVR